MELETTEKVIYMMLGILMGTLVGGFFGYNEGVRLTEKKAVQNKVGHYSANENGQVEFIWGLTEEAR